MVIAPVAYMAMFTGFHAYDDEGYFLVLVRDYVSGRPMLGPTTPIYGPFFLETMGAIFKVLGVAPGHDAGRYITLALWLLASGVAGWTAYRLTQSMVLAIGAELVAFHALVALTNEPMSPQALIGVLLVAFVTAATFRSTRPRLTAVLLGAIVAALCLIKINVGVFVGVAIAMAFAASLPDAFRRWALPAMVVIVSALPLVLTSGLLSQPWVAEFAVGSALSAAAVGVTLLRFHPRSAPLSELAWIVAGAAGVAVLCLGIALAGGTSAANLWNGLVVVSLHFPRVFVAPLEGNIAFDVVAAASFAAALLVAVRGRQDAVSPAVRIVVGISILVALLLLPTSLYLFTLPLVWVAAVRPAGETEDLVGAYVRILVPALVVVNVLQAYPVAGTQQSLAALPQMFAGAICLADAARQARVGKRAPRFAAAAANSAMAVAALSLLVNAAFTVPAYQQAVPLGLPGAQSMRLPADQAAQLRSVVSAINHDCSELVTYPGMDSFYVWTDQASPAELRSEVWMITYDDSQQRSLVDQLQGQPRLCVLKSQRELDFWTKGRPVPVRPMVQFIDQGFTPAGTFGEYVLLVRLPTQ